MCTGEFAEAVTLAHRGMAYVQPGPCARNFAHGQATALQPTKKPPP